MSSVSSTGFKKLLTSIKFRYEKAYGFNISITNHDFSIFLDREWPNLDRSSQILESEKFFSWFFKNKSFISVRPNSICGFSSFVKDFKKRPNETIFKQTRVFLENWDDFISGNGTIERYAL